MSASYVEGAQVVGVDLHRHRTVVVRKDAWTGEVRGAVRIANDPVLLVAEVGKAGRGVQVAIEATNGWYWAVDALQEAGFEVALCHPSGCVGFKSRRVKNDFNDAGDLADLLRLGRLPRAWIAPRDVRELRELVRYRHKLVGARTSMKNQVHAVLAKRGIAVPMADLFGVSGNELLDRLALPAAYAHRVGSLRGLIVAHDAEVDRLDAVIAGRLKHDPGYAAIQAIGGVGPVLAAVLVAEIGEVSRFDRPGRLCSWAGLTPRHRESDTTVHRGKITKQGSPLVRWAVVEAVQRQRRDSVVSQTRERVAGNRGRPIGKVAAGRKLLTLVYYGLRDHHIRSLAPQAAR